MTKLTRADQLARAGYLARGFVYAALGYFAFETRSQADEGQTGVFEKVGQMPAGTAMLWLLVLGLVAYGIYKLAGAFLDLENKGHEPKGLMVRAGMAAGAVAYLAMAWAASRFATGVKQTAESDGNQETVKTVLDMPLGEVMIGIVGLGFLVAAFFQAKNAITRHFMRNVAPGSPPFTTVLGQIGFAARAVVFALVGWSLLRSAWSGEEGEARDLGGVLADLQGSGAIYLIVAAGLLIFGIYSLILSRYRIVPAVDVVGAAKDKAQSKMS